MTDGEFVFDVLVVGAGPAGLAAACAAARNGRGVGLVDASPWLGGQIWRGQTPKLGSPAARKWFARFGKSGVILLGNTTVFAAPEPGVLLAEHNDRGCRLRWNRLVLAPGARELFLPFPGWTLPGVMGPGGLQAMAKHGWPVSDKRVVVAGSGPLLLAAADGLRRKGAKVVAVVEQAPLGNIFRFGLGLSSRPGKLWQALLLKLRLLGIPYRCGAWPVSAEGEGQVRQVTLTDGRRRWTENCDLLACGFGLVPNLELPMLLGCQTTNGCVRVDAYQATTVPNVYCAGEANGVAGADCALVEGEIAGCAAAGDTAGAERLFAKRDSWHRFRQALAHAFALRPEVKALAATDTLVCRCEDVTLGQMKHFRSWRDAKLQSRCGMGACQGRICGAASEVILGWGMQSVRPPLLPVRVGSLVSHPPGSTVS